MATPENGNLRVPRNTHFLKQKKEKGGASTDITHISFCRQTELTSRSKGISEEKALTPGSQQNYRELWRWNWSSTRTWIQVCVQVARRLQKAWRLIPQQLLKPVIPHLGRGGGRIRSSRSSSDTEWVPAWSQTGWHEILAQKVKINHF